MGAKFDRGKWEDTEAKFVLYDTASDVAEAFVIDSVTRIVA
jgi:hypothetical protein